METVAIPHRGMGCSMKPTPTRESKSRTAVTNSPAGTNASAEPCPVSETRKVPSQEPALPFLNVCVALSPGFLHVLPLVNFLPWLCCLV